jgi:hypothetical protein
MSLTRASDGVGLTCTLFTLSDFFYFLTLGYLMSCKGILLAGAGKIISRARLINRLPTSVVRTSEHPRSINAELLELHPFEHDCNLHRETARRNATSLAPASPFSNL